MVDFPLFATNGNKEQKFVFLGRQTMKGNQLLLFQQMCLYVVITPHQYQLSGEERLANVNYCPPVKNCSTV
jgi:hypothetical protein